MNMSTLQDKIEEMEKRVSNSSDEMVNAYNLIGDDELTKEVYKIRRQFLKHQY